MLESQDTWQQMQPSAASPPPSCLAELSASEPGLASLRGSQAPLMDRRQNHHERKMAILDRIEHILTCSMH